VHSGSHQSVLVFDIGGSHVAAAVCAGEGYRLGPVANAPHPKDASSEGFLDLLQTLGKKAMNGCGPVSGVELAFPGPFEYNDGISRMEHKLPYLNGIDLRQPLASRFGLQPSAVRFLNDAAAYLLGEIGAGAAQNVERAVGITLGTGIGSAFAVHGHVVSSGPGVPPGGEIWNLPYEGGILEDALSTRAIQADYQQRTGQLLQVSAIAALATKDNHAAEVFAAFGHHLGQALRSLLQDFAPQVVVLGGGISRSAQLFLPQAQEELKSLDLKLCVTTLFDHAPLAGAGVAWFATANGKAV
jgi:glucokinase